MGLVPMPCQISAKERWLTINCVVLSGTRQVFCQTAYLLVMVGSGLAAAQRDGITRPDGAPSQLEKLLIYGTPFFQRALAPILSFRAMAQATFLPNDWQSVYQA